jgi:signal transduction histidine kinase/CheY-like chemotaxis protein
MAENADNLSPGKILADARLSTEALTALTRVMPVGVGLVDGDGRFVSLNDIGLSIFGLESIAAAPDDLDDYEQLFPMRSLDGRLLAKNERPVARALRGESVVDAEVLMQRHSDHRERLLSISAELLPGRESRLAIFVVHDITDRMLATRELIQAHALIQGITQGTDDLIAAEDSEFRYIFFNDAYEKEFRRLWGTDLEPGMSMLELLAPWPEERDKAKELWQRALSGESFSITADFGQSEARREVYDLRFNPIYDSEGKLIGAAHILRNVTQREEMQDALEHSEEMLRENDRRKDEFLATLAHELRNPLAPIRSGIELLRPRLEDNSIIDMMDRQMTHLVRLVDDLLDLSRISRGKVALRIESVDVADIVESASESVRALFETEVRTLLLEVPEGLPKVRADYVRSVQMLANLLSNAFKFTQERGRIEVSARADGDFVRLNVRDDGAGIAQGKIDRVFELFNQADATEGSGLGIGLTLVRSLAEQHGGHVTAASAGEGRGSEFAIFLPRSDRENVRLAGRDAQKQGRLDGISLLIVDDNEDAAQSLGMLLEALGASVRCVYDGAAALLAVDEQAPDTVLLDIGLPDINGHDVARRIRRKHAPGEVRLVAVTGWAQSQGRNRDQAFAFDAHLVKPVSIDDILEVLETRNAV